MVVLDEVPHVTTRIRVAGELATEYGPLNGQKTVVSLDKEGSKIPTKTCYIESKSGAEFAIDITVSDKYQFPHSHDSFIAHVYIDGQWMTARRIKTLLFPGQPRTVAISSAEFLAEEQRGEAVVSKFIFAPVTKTSDHTSDDRLKSDIKRAETLGTIHLCLETGRCEGTMHWEPPSWHGGREVKLAEKALKGKAISHATSLAETTEKPSTYSLDVRDKRLVGEIFFRYRSYQALQHEMIIPRTPSSEPSATTSLDENELSHLSESDIRRLALERLHDNQVKDEFLQVKREAEENPRTPRQWKFVRLDDGKEAIDLTDD